MPADRATVWIDGAPVTILPKRAPVGNSGPIRGRTLAIFPAPAGAVDLTAALPGQATDRYRATLDPGAQPAQAVADLTEPQALVIGRALGLDEILFWDGRRARILACR